jgi:hypothetical protein
MRLRRLALAVACLCSAPGIAGAEPIPTNNYAIDLFQGAILAPIRVSGIAGSYAGYAEGISGMVSNAAAPAVREAYSVSWVELDLDASISIPLSLSSRDDFDNSGVSDESYSDFVFLTGGALLQYGPVGIGGIAELQRYSIDDSDVTVGKYHLLAAWRLLGDQLMIGAGARATTLGLDAPEAALTMAGISPEVGFLIRPDWRSFRIGATFRAPVDARGLLGGARTVDAAGVERAGGLAVPSKVVLPWELEAGVAIQVGPRPLNPEWADPRAQEEMVERSIAERRGERTRLHEIELSRLRDPAERAARVRFIAYEERRAEAEDRAELERAKVKLKKERRARYWNWPREHLLVTAEILITGAVDKGVSLERFLGQNAGDPGEPSIVGHSGEKVSYSPRFGIETEPVPMRIQTRFGSYYEPSRERDVGRQHFTFGADLRLLTTTWWGLTPEMFYKLQASVDIAPRYESYSLGIGVWH